MHTTQAGQQDSAAGAAGGTAAEAAGEAFVRTGKPEPGISVLTLNRPGTRNSLSLAMMAAIHGALDAAAADSDTGAIILAAGGPVFCSGHDLKELQAHRGDPDGGRAFFADTMTWCSRLMQAIVACPKPVLAAVQGTATAAGCQLVAACDLAVAADTAKFCTPGVNIGLFCSTPAVALSRNISRKHAMEMLLTGEMVPSAQAAEWGLINRAVPPDRVMPETLALARVIAAKSRAAVGFGKKAFYAQAALPLAEAYALASGVMVENMLARDAKEGISAFLEKRPPCWEPC